MEPLIFILLIVIAFLAAIVAGMVGGSYLLMIPIMLFFGLEIHEVIGITKIMTIFVGLVFINYWKKGKVDLKFNFPFALLVVIGSLAGSFFVIQTNAGVLQKVIGILMVAVSLIVLLNRDMGVKKFKGKLENKKIILAAIIGLVLGFYNGMYGAAFSIMVVMLFTLLLKKEFVEAIGSARFLDFAGGIAGAFIFGFNGLIDYSLAIPLGIAYLAGGLVGSQITLKKGSAWVRYVVVIIAVIFAIKLLFF